MESTPDEATTAAHRMQPYGSRSNGSRSYGSRSNGYMKMQDRESEDEQSSTTALPAKPPKVSSGRADNRWKTVLAYLPNTTWTISLCAVLVAQGIACIALQSQAFASWQAALRGSQWLSLARILPAQLATLISESIYQVILALDAVRAQNIVQTVGICLNNLCLLVVVVLGWSAISNADVILAAEAEITPFFEEGLRRIYIALLAVLSASTVLLGLVTWKLASEFAWSIYRNISAADLQMRKRYLIYESYMALLHLSFFFLFGLWVQTLVGVRGLSPFTLSLSFVALLLSFLAVILAALSASRESRVGITIAGILLVALIALAAVGMGLLWNIEPKYLSFILPLRTRLTAYAVLAMLLLVATIVMTVIVSRNFGRGLRPHLRFRRILPDKRQTYIMQDFEQLSESKEMRARVEIE